MIKKCYAILSIIRLPQSRVVVMKNGIKLDNLTITGGMSERRTHRPSDGSAIGGYLVDGLLRNVHER